MCSPSRRISHGAHGTSTCIRGGRTRKTSCETGGPPWTRPCPARNWRSASGALPPSSSEGYDRPECFMKTNLNAPDGETMWNSAGAALRQKNVGPFASNHGAPSSPTSVPTWPPTSSAGSESGGSYRSSVGRLQLSAHSKTFTRDVDGVGVRSGCLHFFETDASLATTFLSNLRKRSPQHLFLIHSQQKDGVRHRTKSSLLGLSSGRLAQLVKQDKEWLDPFQRYLNGAFRGVLDSNHDWSETLSRMEGVDDACGDLDPENKTLSAYQAVSERLAMTARLSMALGVPRVPQRGVRENGHLGRVHRRLHGLRKGRLLHHG